MPNLTLLRDDACRVYAAQSVSMLDWPGRLSAVLFLSGCNLVVFTVITQNFKEDISMVFI